MKNSFVAALSLAIALKTSGQTQGSTTPAQQDTPYAVAARDADCRVWERTTYEQGESGKVVAHIHRYTEMETGMNYQQNGQWVESSETIAIQPQGGAAATQGQHQVYFPYDIYDGVIELVTPDGKHLKSRPLEIAYYDGANSVMIAELKHSIGQILPSGNQVIYTNAFTDFAADLVCTYRKWGFESDLVFREQPPVPETFGLRSGNSRIELLTEFFDTPDPQRIATNTIAQSTSDITLRFGGMTMVRGKAFAVGAESANTTTDPALVSKSWTDLEGRTFLIEELPVNKIATDLRALPSPAQGLASANASVRQISMSRQLPPSRIAANGHGQPLANGAKARPMQLAAADLNRKPGVVLDYVTLTSLRTNYTFYSSQTYYISGVLSLWGNNVIEGATVFKYPAGIGAEMDLYGALTFTTGPYRPAVFTASDDNTVGEPISGSSGSPGTTYGRIAIATTASYPGPGLDVHDVRVLYKGAAFSFVGYDNLVRDSQICTVTNKGIVLTSGATVHLENVLFDKVDTVLQGTGNAEAEQITAHEIGKLNNLSGTASFTNSLFITVTNMGNSFADGFNVTNMSSSGIFQVVGGGGHYLATNSIFRNAGTTNLDSSLLADLKLKTTYPPIVYLDTSINLPQTFSPVVQRDNDVPDLGYHYDPMDYAFSGVDINKNVTFSAGTAVGWFCAGSDDHGLHLADKQIASFEGTVETPDYFVRCSTVQEGGTGNWTKSWDIRGVIGTADQHTEDVTLSPEWRMRFTTCSVLSWGEQIFRDWSGYLIVRANHSRVVGGNNGGYVISCYFTNCLIEGMQGGQVEGHTGNEWIMRNCTWHYGIFYMSRSRGIPVSARDCAFDATSYSLMDAYYSNPTYTDYDYNAYTNAADPFPIGGAHDRSSVNFEWQIGPLGNFYVPWYSVLIDHGSTTADQVGLYHFTTQTPANSAEGTSTVDIGYHYVAIGDYGNPLDTDGDGTPDYIEDANGNGTVDNGETDWQSATDLGLKVFITRPKNNSFIP